MNPKPWLALTLLCALPAAAAPLQLHGRVVFNRASKGLVEVWTMKPDGTDQKPVWHVPKGYGHFGGFSQDGTRAISFNNFNVYVHDLRTERFEKVLGWSNGWGTYIARPSFSPDGQQLLCEVGDFNGNSTNLYVKRLQCPPGSPFPTLERRFDPAPGRDSGFFQWSAPQWADDGKHVIALGGPSYSATDPRSGPDSLANAAEFYTMNPDGSHAHRLDLSTGGGAILSWSRDRRYAATVRSTVVDPADDSLLVTDLWVTDMEKHTQTQLTFHDQEVKKFPPPPNLSPDINTLLFSPDGRHILFSQNGIHSIDIDGKNEHVVLKDGGLMQWIW